MSPEDVMDYSVFSVQQSKPSDHWAFGPLNLFFTNHRFESQSLIRNAIKLSKCSMTGPVERLYERDIRLIHCLTHSNTTFVP